MMKSYCLILYLAMLFFACTNNPKQPASADGETEVKLNKNASDLDSLNVSPLFQWLRGSGLNRPESMVFDPINQVFYVSNGKDYQVSKDGFISKISIEGNLLELKWISALNRPTGMAVYKDRLYVADFNVLRVIDTRNGKIIQQLPEPINNSGLNDVAISAGGEVFVTASFVHSVFKVKGDQLVPWAIDEEKLKWANGLLVEHNRVLVAGLHLNAIDLRSKEITEVYKNAEIMDFDGLATDGHGGYFLTTVGNSALWHLNAQNQAEKVTSGKAYFGDLTTVATLNNIYIPRGHTSTEDFFISVHSMNP